MTRSSKIDDAIDRLMRDPNALRSEPSLTPQPGGRDHYDPTQPRVPAGDPRGGQWTAGGYRGVRSNRDVAEPIPAGLELTHHPTPPGWRNEGHFGDVGLAYSPGVVYTPGPYDPATDTYVMSFTGRGRVEISTPHPSIRGAVVISTYAVDPSGTGMGLSVTIRASTNEVTVAGTSGI